MAINSTHPEYDEKLVDWTTMQDCYAGERTIKEAGVKYLPPTAGQIADGMTQSTQPGAISYNNYRLRSRFPDAVYTAVSALLGIMHAKPPTIELPDAMESMRENATDQGESLEVLLRRINEQQLITGRVGLLLDIDDGAPVGTLPYIAPYNARTILNWDEGHWSLDRNSLNLVILDESTWKRTDDFEWEFENKYRVLVLGDPTDNEPVDGSVYRVGVWEDVDASFNEDELITPSIGGRPQNEIPFVFINTSDIVATPDKPPLLGLAELSLGIYRLESDYRLALYLQGQDTLVVTGSSDPEQSFRTGVGASITLPTGGTAEYIGVSSAGLPEMRQALENDRAEAALQAGSLMDVSSRAQESGDALKIRVASRTATLNQLALTGAFGLEQSLKQAARWLGLNEDEVVVTPNLDFVNDSLGGEELVRLMTAKSLGAPISNESIHRQMSEKNLTEMTLEEELDSIEEEEPLGSTSRVISAEEREQGGTEET